METSIILVDGVFTYKPLSPGFTTRILEIQPASDQQSPLVGRLIDINIDTDYDYEAISYCWGQPLYTDILVLQVKSDGFEKRLSKLITANLRDALRRFRLSGKVRRLWVDAICIDQGNNAEKSFQIQAMADIYRRAVGTLVWLGQTESGEACLQRLNLLSRPMVSRQDTQVYSTVNEAILELQQLPWFSRRWVVQELVLSPVATLFCGKASIAWIRVQKMVEYVTRDHQIGHRYSGEPIAQLMASLWRHHNLPIRDGSGAGHDVLDIMTIFHDLKCADDKDRIFAFVGLSTDSLHHPTRATEQQLVDTNYELSTDAIYQNFASSYLRRYPTGLNDILRLVAMQSATSDPNIASWVPDWRQPLVRNPRFPRKSSEELNLSFVAKVLDSHEGIKPTLWITPSPWIADSAMLLNGSVETVLVRDPCLTSNESVIRFLRCARQLANDWILQRDADIELKGKERYLLSLLLLDAVTATYILGQEEQNEDNKFDNVKHMFIHGTKRVFDLGKTDAMILRAFCKVFLETDKPPSLDSDWLDDEEFTTRQIDASRDMITCLCGTVRSCMRGHALFIHSPYVFNDIGHGRFIWPELAIGPAHVAEGDEVISPGTRWSSGFQLFKRGIHELYSHHSIESLFTIYEKRSYSLLVRRTRSLANPNLESYNLTWATFKLEGTDPIDMQHPRRLKFTYRFVGECYSNRYRFYGPEETESVREGDERLRRETAIAGIELE